MHTYWCRWFLLPLCELMGSVMHWYVLSAHRWRGGFFSNGAQLRWNTTHSKQIKGLVVMIDCFNCILSNYWSYKLAQLKYLLLGYRKSPYCLHDIFNTNYSWYKCYEFYDYYLSTMISEFCIKLSNKQHHFVGKKGIMTMDNKCNTLTWIGNRPPSSSQSFWILSMYRKINGGSKNSLADYRRCRFLSAPRN